MTKHIVIDTETLSTRSDAALLSIGAVVYDDAVDAPAPSLDAVCDPGDGIHDLSTRLGYPAFYVNIHDSTGHVDPKTVRWWLGQAGLGSPSAGARTALTTPGFHEPVALEYFDAWLHRQGGSDFRIWAHATFDQPIVASAYDRYPTGNYERWPYYVSRDLRTVFELAGGLTGHEPDLDAGYEGQLVEHHALHDAYREAVALRRALSRVRHD